MSFSRPLFTNEANTARLLDLSLEKFRECVRNGHLPRGREIAPGEARWDVEDLRAILRGDAVGGMSDVKW